MIVVTVALAVVMAAASAAGAAPAPERSSATTDATGAPPTLLAGTSVPLVASYTSDTNVGARQMRSAPSAVDSPPSASATIGPKATFVVNYDSGFLANPAAKASFQAAIDAWSNTVSSTVPIVVTAVFGTSGCGSGTFSPGVLGSAGPSGFVENTPNVPKANVAYPLAMANAFANQDIFPSVDDICAVFNAGRSDWYFGTDGATPFAQYDFESVALHELGHGLGFIGTFDQGPTATQGQCCFNGTPAAFDVQAVRGDGTAMLSYPQPSTQVLTALTSNDVYFRGPTTAVVAGASGAKLYAPATFDPGSSFSHLDEATYPAASGNALMTPMLDNGESEHSPGPLTIAMFEDMGWILAAAPPGAPTGVSALPGDANATVTWNAPLDDGGATITSYTVTSSPQGKTCTWSAGPRTCTVTGLTNGTSYTFTVRATNSAGQGPASAPSLPVVPAPPPTVPSAPLVPLAAAGNGAATVSWSPPVTDGGAAITSYTVTSSPQGVTCTWTSGPLSCTVGGLTNSIAYQFSVIATNSVGPSPASAFSNTVIPGAATAPGAPTGVTATAGHQAAAVTWVAPAVQGGSAISGYVVTSTPGNQSCTTPGSALGCTVAGLTGGVSYTFTVRATNDAGFGAASTASNAVVPWSGSSFHPSAPTRLLDSRLGQGFTGPLASGLGNTSALHVTGGAVPNSAAAVVLNVTVTGGTANSFLTVFPSGEPVPGASNLNFAVGETIPNLVTVKVGAGGNVSFFNAIGSVQVVGDLMGYYDDGSVSGDRFTPLDPTRILDTRTGNGFSGKVSAGTTRDLTLPTSSVPSSASAVVINVTATNATQPSFLTVYPAGTQVPTASNLNFAAGQTIPNLAVVKVGANDTISFFNAVGAVDVVVDVVGYFDPGGGAYFHALSPTRILDSRTTVGGFNGPVSAGTPKALQVANANGVPGAATAAVMNTTVTGGTNASFLTVFPFGGAVPNASNLNFATGQTIPNLVTVKLGGFGRVSFANAVGSVQTVADLVGYYAAF